MIIALFCAGVGGAVPGVCCGGCCCGPWPPVAAGRLRGEECTLEIEAASGSFFGPGEGGGIIPCGLFCCCGGRFPVNWLAPGRDPSNEVSIAAGEDVFVGIMFVPPPGNLCIAVIVCRYYNLHRLRKTNSSGGLNLLPASHFQEYAKRP